MTTNPQAVLLLGASGFIGGDVLRALLHAQIKVIAVRHRPAPRLISSAFEAQAEASGQLEWINLDMARLTSATNWDAHLGRVGAVINCVGILRQRA
jgi:uncharacterized protein YbjT (DUF2867 family)